mmetsp:Transcript_42678/g.69397  ORF Transcript_42678/g.69397 Transcript_42678/m.69397 type:complete len:110 (+) Transcript_42678:791-1120(+)
MPTHSNSNIKARRAIKRSMSLVAISLAKTAVTGPTTEVPAAQRTVRRQLSGHQRKHARQFLPRRRHQEGAQRAEKIAKTDDEALVAVAVDERKSLIRLAQQLESETKTD